MAHCTTSLLFAAEGEKSECSKQSVLEGRIVVHHQRNVPAQRHGRREDDETHAHVAGSSYGVQRQCEKAELRCGWCIFLEAGGLGCVCACEFALTT